MRDFGDCGLRRSYGGISGIFFLAGFILGLGVLEKRLVRFGGKARKIGGRVGFGYGCYVFRLC